MIDGIPVVDAHLHPARLSTLKMSVQEWAAGFKSMDGIYDDEGAVIPDAFDAYLEAEGVDVAIMFCEYSPLTTGVQPIEDLLPIAAANPARLRFIANVNPHMHGPAVEELNRQLALGAVGLKLHPVHAHFAPNDAKLWPLYARCAEAGLPVVFHCGTSVFPGAVNRFADPALMDEVAGAFPDLKIVLAHGGRGWWYDAAAFISQMRDNVWIELSGLPPKKLPQYYRNFDLGRLSRKFIFATDWPGVPGIARNAAALADLGFDRDTLEKIFWRNAFSVYGLGPPPAAWE
ncbi:MAG TPA: amidohydrolase family protein [Acidimicrobiia bacterium]|nr:amidohydrolase family protein [Acidimicrobiia bacterium]